MYMGHREHLRRYDMNGRFQKQGGKNWFLPKEMNENRFFWDSHWLEIWSKHICPSMWPNGGSVAMDSGDEIRHFLSRCLWSIYLFVKKPEVLWLEADLGLPFFVSSHSPLAIDGKMLLVKIKQFYIQWPSPVGDFLKKCCAVAIKLSWPEYLGKYPLPPGGGDEYGS